MDLAFNVVDSYRNRSERIKWKQVPFYLKLENVSIFCCNSFRCGSSIVQLLPKKEYCTQKRDWGAKYESINTNRDICLHNFIVPFCLEKSALEMQLVLMQDTRLVRQGILSRHTWKIRSTHEGLIKCIYC